IAQPGVARLEHARRDEGGHREHQQPGGLALHRVELRLPRGVVRPRREGERRAHYSTVLWKRITLSPISATEKPTSISASGMKASNPVPLSSTPRSTRRK